MPNLTFELLFEEIRRACWLTPDQAHQLERVAALWENQRLWLPSRQHWLRQRAFTAACRLLLGGEPVPLARQRLMSMGCSRRGAYRALARAQRAIRQQRLG